MKMYFICEDQGPQWFYSYGVLDNGFCFGEHVCSHPNFAPSDLYFRRKERISALQQLFDINPETIETETIIVKVKTDIPKWWDGHAALQDGLKTKYNEYKQLLDKLRAKKETTND